ncbi:MAG: ATPase domain-containing protein [Thermoplasmata archaeon]
MDKYPTNTVLDSVLEGGFETGIINQIYGEAGAGKTNIVLVFLREVIKRNDWAILINTEPFNMNRLAQIFGNEYSMKNLLISEPKTMNELLESLEYAKKAIEKNEQIKSLVVDSITILYRKSYDEETQRMDIDALSKQMQIIREISHIRDVCVIVTNQVHYNPNTKTEEPLGGMVLSNFSKAIYKVERVSNYSEERKFTVIKSRNLKINSYVLFRITANGIVEK